MVKEFIETNEPSKTLVLPDRLMINQCFYHFKSLYKNLERKKGGAAAITASDPSPSKNHGNIPDNRSEMSVPNKPDPQ
jgi:hypothetical protein